MGLFYIHKHIPLRLAAAPAAEEAACTRTQGETKKLLATSGIRFSRSSTPVNDSSRMQHYKL